MPNPIALTKAFVQNSDAQINMRIYSWATPAVPMLEADLTLIEFAAFNLPDESEAYALEELDIATVISDTLLGAGAEDAQRWSADSIGYNFSHSVPGAAFQTPGKIQLEYRFTGTLGQVLGVVIRGLIVPSYMAIGD